MVIKDVKCLQGHNVVVLIFDTPDDAKEWYKQMTQTSALNELYEKMKLNPKKVKPRRF